MLTPRLFLTVAHSPLYMVGGGDLGTNANDLDNSLSSIFSLATAWKAVVLIDEADVFLERRSKDDLKRNAMVSVFLRQLEYVHLKQQYTLLSLIFTPDIIPVS